MNPSIEPHAKNNADTAAGKSKYKMPVSRAFYKKVTEKGRKIIFGLKLDESSAAILQKYIDDYINNDTLPECPAAPDAPYIVFSVLRLEIDEAIKRSAAARRRAAERREKRKHSSSAGPHGCNDIKGNELPEVFEKDGIRCERHGDFYHIYPPGYLR